ncbi:trans-aconitate 2-methyltransferase [Steroidobacter sp.]|uniref:trans-aconitate 2-methyltransferase n=1 Tax=Steroidobacter sp. TaxID=1978227 RepID=UPI001A4795B1|nr:trans-aconitate 2-methyltransferase [Steroidobacter sp.]MBL8267237.1 trans-aconitate 2-methyltransferase [Steroidobacter sp.]
MTWSANQYTRFESERTRPARDLVAAIPQDSVQLAVDLGCGPGNSTEALLARYPTAAVSGIDSSEDMIDTARKRLPHLNFEVGDIGRWKADRAVDVILANASLQWLPDHQTLYPRLLAQLAKGGCLAVQTPDNLSETPHRAARELAASAQWANKIGSVRHPDRHEAQWYYSLLRPLCSRVDVWRTTYFHELQGHQAVVEWFKGTALRPFVAPLDAQERETFLGQYLDKISAEMPMLEGGTVLLPFPRLFIVAQRSA